MPQYKLEYKIDKVDGNQTAACNSLGDSTKYTKQNACELGYQATHTMTAIIEPTDKYEWTGTKVNRSRFVHIRSSYAFRHTC
jgi:hypothetical protein